MSASRKWFSSHSMLRIIQICFCLSTTWTFVQSEFYKVTSLNPMDVRVEGKYAPVKMTLAGSAFLFIKRHDEKSYTAQLENLDMSVTHLVGGMRVKKCPEFQPLATAIRKPFKVFLDDSANFKSMKVSKSDMDRSIAIKFYIATWLQANKQKLGAEKVPFDDQMVTSFGKCTVNYMRSSKAGEQSYSSVLRQLKPDTCSVAAAEDDKQFVSSICRPKSQAHYTFVDYVRLRNVNFKSQEFDIQTNGRLWFKPKKDKDDFFTGNFGTTFDLNPSRLGEDLEKQKGSNRDPEPFNDADSKDVTEVPYINIDRDLIKGGPSNVPAQLYRMLACYPDRKNLFMALMHIVASC